MNNFSTNNYSSNFDNSSRNRSSLNLKKFKRYMKRSTIIPFAAVGIMVVVISIILINNAAQTKAVSVPILSRDNRVEVEKPKAVQKLNKQLSFPLKDEKGKEVSKFTYEVLDAELRDEIIVKGQRATAVKGRTFLVVNLKITNNYDKNIKLNVKDFLRLSVNNSAEKLAPDIHNDPVDIQAISTKYTKVGFPINDTDKNLTLQVGEISGNKETIKLSL